MQVARLASPFTLFSASEFLALPVCLYICSDVDQLRVHLSRAALRDEICKTSKLYLSCDIKDEVPLALTVAGEQHINDGKHLKSQGVRSSCFSRRNSPRVLFLRLPVRRATDYTRGPAPDMCSGSLRVPSTLCSEPAQVP